MQRHLIAMSVVVGAALVVSASAQAQDHKLISGTNSKSAFGTPKGSGLAALKGESSSALAPKAPSDKMTTSHLALASETIKKPKAYSAKLAQAMFEGRAPTESGKGLAALQGASNASTATDPAVQQLVSSTEKKSPSGQTRNFLR